jgi:arginine decarboxylase
LAQGRQRLRHAAADPAAVTVGTRTGNRAATRDAFFGTVETVPAEKASGRVCAEQITPYPPGIPAAVPGELLNDAVIDYLHAGLEAGMNVPDAADTSLKTFRVVA